MWNRYELKTKAKAAFHANYWKCVAVALIVSLLVGGGLGSIAQIRLDTSHFPSVPSNSVMVDEFFSEGSMHLFEDVALEVHTSNLFGFATSLIIAFLTTFLTVAVIGGALKVFIFNLFEIGGSKFFLRNASQSASFGEIVCAFEGNSYLKCVLTMFLRDLFVALWSMLLVIPGIVKAYEYRMIPYLLADHPELTRKEAFAASRRMMSGHKWRAFVLDLSFIGWNLLSAMTMGLLFVFYVNPYQIATSAELYLALKNNSGKSFSE